MTIPELRALMNTPGPVGPTSPIVAAALIALPDLLDAVEAAQRLREGRKCDCTVSSGCAVSAFDAAVGRLGCSTQDPS